eukprot:939671_1
MHASSSVMKFSIIARCYVLRVLTLIFAANGTFCAQGKILNVPPLFVQESSGIQASKFAQNPRVSLAPSATYTYIEASSSSNRFSTKVLSLKAVQSRFLPAIPGPSSVLKWGIITNTGSVHNVAKSDFLLPHDASGTTFRSAIAKLGLTYDPSVISTALVGCPLGKLMCLKDCTNDAKIHIQNLTLDFRAGMFYSVGATVAKVDITAVEVWCESATQPMNVAQEYRFEYMFTPITYALPTTGQYTAESTTPSYINATGQYVSKTPTTTATTGGPETTFQFNNYATDYNFNFFGNHQTVNIGRPQTKCSKSAFSAVPSPQKTNTSTHQNPILYQINRNAQVTPPTFSTTGVDPSTFAKYQKRAGSGANKSIGSIGLVQENNGSNFQKSNSYLLNSKPPQVQPQPYNWISNQPIQSQKYNLNSLNELRENIISQQRYFESIYSAIKTPKKQKNYGMGPESHTLYPSDYGRKLNGSQTRHPIGVARQKSDYKSSVNTVNHTQNGQKYKSENSTTKISNLRSPEYCHSECAPSVSSSDIKSNLKNEATNWWKCLSCRSSMPYSSNCILCGDPNPDAHVRPRRKKKRQWKQVLYVSNFPKCFDLEKLADLFVKYGPIMNGGINIKISRGDIPQRIAFVYFENASDATNAKVGLNRHKFDEQEGRLRVTWARNQVD